MADITLRDSYREQLGHYTAEALQRVLNYPVGADMILSVIPRGWRPAEILTAKRSKIPLLVIHDRELIEKAQKAADEGWRVMFETRIPRGGGDEYITKIEPV